ncbi:MAG: UpxY family transcription antiterminator [Terriglobia bacterium]
MPEITSLIEAEWYALYTRHQHEKTVEDLLSKKGFQVFLPLYKSQRRWKDRIKTLSLPLFPSYVFVHGGMERQLDIIMTPGVYSMVTAAGKVAIIPGEEIEAVRRMVENSVRVEPHPFLKCGDWVRVKAGPLAGIEGILTRIKGLFRLVISVEMLQQSVAVEVDASVVERTERRISSSSQLSSASTGNLRTMCSDFALGA